MKNRSAIICLFMTFTLAGFPARLISADILTHVSVVSADDFLASPDENPPRVEKVYISKEYSHFAEDFHSDKTIPNYVDRYSFSVFRIEKGKLLRDIYFIANPEGIDGDGFYEIDYQVTKSNIKTRLRINEVRLERIVKKSEMRGDITDMLVAAIRDRISRIGSRSLSPLYRHYAHLRPFTAIRSAILPQKGRHTGVNALEFLGLLKGKYLYRAFLCNADSLSFKKEGDIARGYFLYLSYDDERKGIDCYYTVVDFPASVE
ncbi:MAG TPA: hypothetical protein VF857_07740 [Spirochaetota bacterium]